MTEKAVVGLLSHFYLLWCSSSRNSSFISQDFVRSLQQSDSNPCPVTCHSSSFSGIIPQETFQSPNSISASASESNGQRQLFYPILVLHIERTHPPIRTPSNDIMTLRFYITTNNHIFSNRRYIIEQIIFSLCKSLVLDKTVCICFSQIIRPIYMYEKVTLLSGRELKFLWFISQYCIIE